MEQGGHAAPSQKPTHLPEQQRRLPGKAQYEDKSLPARTGQTPGHSGDVPEQPVLRAWAPAPILPSPKVPELDTPSLGKGRQDLGGTNDHQRREGEEKVKGPSSNPGFPGGLGVKNLPAMQEMRVQSLGREDPLEEVTTTTPVFLTGESHGQRSLAGYSPGVCEESDTTEAT